MVYQRDVAGEHHHAHVGIVKGMFDDHNRDAVRNCIHTNPRLAFVGRDIYIAYDGVMVDGKLGALLRTQFETTRKLRLTVSFLKKRLAGRFRKGVIACVGSWARRHGMETRKRKKSNIAIVCRRIVCTGRGCGQDLCSVEMRGHL